MTLRLGIIGCGQWGQNYVRVFRELDGCRVVAVCDREPARLREAERHAPGVRTLTDAADVLQDPEIDAVVVATEASSHFNLVRDALQAGKDCLVEKPMTTSSVDARILSEMAESEGRILMVGHIFVHNAGVGYIHRMLRSGALGSLQYLAFTRTNLGPIRNDVNVVWDLMSHDASILLHWLHQAPDLISAQGACFLRPDCQDVAFATMSFPSGVIANFRASWLDPQKVREITLVGTGKMAVFNDLDLAGPVRVYDKGAIREPNYQSFGEFKLVTRTGEVVIPAIPGTEPLKNQCREFMECVTTRRQPITNARAGLRVVEVLEAIDASIARDGAPVPRASEPLPA